MNKRPPAVTVIAGIFLLTGLVGIAYHATEFKRPGPFHYDLVWVLLLRLVAVVCAVFLLRAANWARWLLVVWIAGHVVIGALHSPLQLIVHGLLFALIVYFLFRRSASAYFRDNNADPAGLKGDLAKP